MEDVADLRGTQTNAGFCQNTTCIMSEKPNVGDSAPSFTAQVTGGDYGEEATLNLSDLAGETVVLYFYPKDHTPGCTIQACDLRDHWDTISAKAKVFGISTDSLKSHQKFAERKKLPFPLISDTDREIVKAYGVWKEKSLMGKLGLGTERTTFVIGPDQKIKAVLEKVSPSKHVSLILDTVK